MEITQDEKLVKLEELRTKLEPILDGVELLKNDKFLLRCLRIHSNRVENAVATVLEYEKLRKKYDTEQILKEEFPKDFRNTHAVYIGGRDLEGRPLSVIPSVQSWDLKQAINKGQEELFIQHILKWAFSFERLVLERDVDFGYFILDAKNSGRMALSNSFSKKSLQTAIHLFGLVQKVIPGIIKKVYIINTPKIFATLFNMVLALIKIDAEVLFFDSDGAKWKEAMSKFIPEDGVPPHFGGTCDSFVHI